MRGRTGKSNLSDVTGEEEEGDPDELAKFFPSFMWVVRDFTLRLLDNEGNKINSREYLEQSLREQRGTSDAVENKNRVRRMIVSFFRDRDCFTMVRPTEDERDLQKLQEMQNERMRPEFLAQMEALRAKIFKRVKPKALNGRCVTGETLLELCEAYTQAINSGNVPCIESAWTYICKNESLRAQQQSIPRYRTAI